MKAFGKFIGIICTLTVIVFVAGWYLGAVKIDIDLSRIKPESPKLETQQVKKSIAKENNTSTRDEAERAFAKLDKEMWTSIKNHDQKVFESLLEGLNDADKQTMSEIYTSFQKDAPSLTRTYTHIIAEANGYYYAEAIHYLTTVNGTQQDESDRSYTLYIQKINGNWKVVSPDEDTRTACAENIISLCPEGLRVAFNNNQNYMFFGNFYWMNSRGVFENVITSTIVYAWQNEDGSVDVAVSFANGHNTIHQIKKCTVELKDEKLGQILKATESINVQVLPGTREIYTMHVKAGKVRKGIWSNVSSSTNISY